LTGLAEAAESGIDVNALFLYARTGVFINGVVDSSVHMFPQFWSIQYGRI
jgi:hypothetical protein